MHYDGFELNPPFFEKVKTHNNILFKRQYLEAMVAASVVKPKVTIIEVVTNYLKEINQKIAWPANEVTKKPVFSDRYSIKPVGIEQLSPRLLHILYCRRHNGFLTPRKSIVLNEQHLPDYQSASDKK